MVLKCPHQRWWGEHPRESPSLARDAFEVGVLHLAFGADEVDCSRGWRGEGEFTVDVLMIGPGEMDHAAVWIVGVSAIFDVLTFAILRRRRGL